MPLIAEIVFASTGHHPTSEELVMLFLLTALVWPLARSLWRDGR